MNSHYNRQEPKVNSNSYTYIYKKSLDFILCILYIYILYILTLYKINKGPLRFYLVISSFIRFLH